MKAPTLHAKKINILIFAIALCKAIVHDFIYKLSRGNEVQVWQKTDRYGNNYWQVYDPKTSKSTSLNSEAEVRIWIEQRYYESK